MHIRTVTGDIAPAHAVPSPTGGRGWDHLLTNIVPSLRHNQKYAAHYVSSVKFLSQWESIFDFNLCIFMESIPCFIPAILTSMKRASWQNAPPLPGRFCVAARFARKTAAAIASRARQAYAGPA